MRGGVDGRRGGGVGRRGGRLSGGRGGFMPGEGERDRRVVGLLGGVMAVAAEVHPDLIEVIS